MNPNVSPARLKKSKYVSDLPQCEHCDKSCLSDKEYSITAGAHGYSFCSLTCMAQWTKENL